MRRDFLKHISWAGLWALVFGAASSASTPPTPLDLTLVEATIRQQTSTAFEYRGRKVRWTGYKIGPDSSAIVGWWISYSDVATPFGNCYRTVSSSVTSQDDLAEAVNRCLEGKFCMLEQLNKGVVEG